MRFQWLTCVLLGSLCYAQAPAKPAETAAPKAPSATAAADTKEPEAQVQPTDPVITIKGICEDAAKKGDDCKTVVTREQFEKLAEAVRPKMPPPVRRQLATYYSRMVPMAIEAEKRGLDKQPKFEELLRFARMQILSQELSNTLQKESQDVSDADIEKTYKDNPAAYEEATLQRIFIPRVKQVAPPAAKPGAKAKEEDSAAQQKANEEAMKKTAAELRARAAAGEDFDKLQKDAFTAAGVKGTPPSTKMEKVRQSTLPQSQKAVLALKAGQVSELISDPTGHYVYKLVSKNTLPLDSVKSEIKNSLGNERYRNAMQPYQQSNVDLNAAYFGQTKAPAMPARPGERHEEEGNESDPD